VHYQNQISCVVSSSYYLEHSMSATGDPTASTSIPAIGGGAIEADVSRFHQNSFQIES